MDLKNYTSLLNPWTPTLTYFYELTVGEVQTLCSTSLGKVTA